MTSWWTWWNFNQLGYVGYFEKKMTNWGNVMNFLTKWGTGWQFDLAQAQVAWGNGVFGGAPMQLDAQRAVGSGQPVWVITWGPLRSPRRSKIRIRCLAAQLSCSFALFFVFFSRSFTFRAHSRLKWILFSTFFSSSFWSMLNAIRVCSKWCCHWRLKSENLL